MAHGAPNAGEVGIKCAFRPVDESPAQTPYRRKFVSIRVTTVHVHARQCAIAEKAVSSTTLMVVAFR